MEKHTKFLDMSCMKEQTGAAKLTRNTSQSVPRTTHFRWFSPRAQTSVHYPGYQHACLIFLPIFSFLLAEIHNKCTPCGCNKVMVLTWLCRFARGILVRGAELHRRANGSRLSMSPPLPSTQLKKRTKSS